MGKTIIKVLKILVAVVSGLNVAAPLILDAQTLFPSWNWQYHVLIGFGIFIIVIVWIIYDLNKRLQSILNAKPRLVFKRIERRKDISKVMKKGAQIEVVGTPEFIRIWIANEPLLPEEGVEAELLHGEIEYYDQERDTPLFTMGGRWPEQGQPAGSLLTQQLTIPPNRKEFCMDIGMKYAQDNEYYGYDDEAHLISDGRNPRTRLDKGVYFLKLTLACKGLIQRFYFRLENQGKGHDVSFDVISESDFDKREAQTS